MKKISLAAILAASVLGACATETPQATDPITQAVAGKRLVADRGDYVDVKADGTLSGMVGPEQTEELAGTWEIQNGQWCRTLTLPANFTGSACQDATLNDDGTLTIDGVNGPVVWAIQ